MACGASALLAAGRIVPQATRALEGDTKTTALPIMLSAPLSGSRSIESRLERHCGPHSGSGNVPYLRERSPMAHADREDEEHETLYVGEESALSGSYMGPVDCEEHADCEGNDGLSGKFVM